MIQYTYSNLQVRHLITMIMSVLLQHGLDVIAGVDVSRKVDSKAMFILRSCAPVTMSDHVAIAPLSNDRLAMIGMGELQVSGMRRIVQQYSTPGW